MEEKGEYMKSFWAMGGSLVDEDSDIPCKGNVVRLWSVEPRSNETI